MESIEQEQIKIMYYSKAVQEMDEAREILSRAKKEDEFFKLCKENMDFKINLESLINLEDNCKINTIQFQKMLLLFNAIEEGWTVKRKNESYVFTKNHENKKEVLQDSYLLKFMKTNLDLNKIIS